MTQTFWEADVAVEQQQKHESSESLSLSLSATDFSALEERIVRAVELVKSERKARTAAEERAAKAEAQLGKQGPVVDQLRDEVRTLRAERDQVRQRVERLLTQLDSLEL